MLRPSQSKQFAMIGLPPKQRQKKTGSVAVTTVTKSIQSANPRAQVVSRQIPRGFVSPLAADSKFIDLALASNFLFNTTGVILHLDTIPTGDSVSQRTGKSFQLTNFQLRGSIYAGTTATVQHIALYLVWDRQPNKALAAITDVLDAALPTALAKRENKGRFLVIKKWQRVLSGNSATPSTGREIIVVDKWIRLPAECIAQCTAADTTGAIGNRVTGALLMLSVGDKVAGTTAATMTAAARLGFRDPN